MRIRQLALVARDLTPAVPHLKTVFGLGDGFEDPGVGSFGLVNTVLPVGDTFLEVVSPKQEGTTAGRLLERRAGDGGYMVIIQVDGDDLSLTRERDRMKDLGVRIVFDHALENIATLHLHPRDVGAAILSLDLACPSESWLWAGPDWESRTRSNLVHGIVGAALQSKDPQATAARWAQILDRPLESSREGDPAISLDAGSTLRFLPDRDGRGDGLSEIDLATKVPEQVLENARAQGLPVDSARRSIDLGGVRFHLIR